ncbi:MAG: hypothetical protein RKE50_12320 [Pseudohaliea sp.]
MFQHVIGDDGSLGSAIEGDTLEIKAKVSGLQQVSGSVALAMTPEARLQHGLGREVEDGTRELPALG